MGMLYLNKRWCNIQSLVVCVLYSWHWAMIYNPSGGHGKEYLWATHFSRQHWTSYLVTWTTDHWKEHLRAFFSSVKFPTKTRSLTNVLAMSKGHTLSYLFLLASDHNCVSSIYLIIVYHTTQKGAKCRISTRRTALTIMQVIVFKIPSIQQTRTFIETCADIDELRDVITS